MHMYQVTVGNIGTVYDGDDKNEAARVYAVYVKRSLNNEGRGAGESVTFWENGEPTGSVEGTLDAASER